MARPKGQLVNGRLARSRRQALDLTQEELAEKCALTRALIQKAERGGPLSSPSITAISAALDIPVDLLVVVEDWNLTLEERIFAPLRPEASRKIGSAWEQPRETLYSLPPRQLIIIALRSAARVLPAFGPRNAEASGHFLRLAEGLGVALESVGHLLDERNAKVDFAALDSVADGAFLAAGFARPGEYDNDSHAADAAFACAIACARVISALQIEIKRSADTVDADLWRVVEFGASACHAAGHASVYLMAADAFIRAGTMDTHDLRNHGTSPEVIAKPLWEDGNLPAPLDHYMRRLTRLEHFPLSVRVAWNRWCHKGFSRS